MNYQIIKNKYNPFHNAEYEDVKKLISQNGVLLKYINNQTEELCRLAVNNTSIALEYVDDVFIHLF